ncbi:MAG TPA: hypothetical protein VHT25_03600 [Solirubrobacteraceae bacterium]|jgi:hypothetical protein|nr:hypothetical protein [Solirubrobacteraceae bacterium]
METLDYQRSGAREPPRDIISLLVARNTRSYETQHVEEEWGLLSRAPQADAGADEAAIIAEEESPSRMMLGPDEVSLESISLALAKGPVVIQATDDQARRIMERHRRDAFPPG